jgi:hypothetical protein
MNGVLTMTGSSGMVRAPALEYGEAKTRNSKSEINFRGTERILVES